MQRLTVLFFVLAILAIGGGAVWYLTKTSGNSLSFPNEEVATTTPLTDSLAIYTNGIYGFSLFYPEAADVRYSFDATYHLGISWRALALPEVAGTPIVAILPYAIENENSFPRYFYAMVRIGASDDPRELARCEKRAEDQGETQLPDVTIGGKVWKAFSFESAGMMQYASGISYRTLHEGRCIAMEQVRTGSSYQEDAPSQNDVAQEVLDSEYDKLNTIVQSFSFAR